MLTEEQRARWVALAGQAADEARLPGDPAFRAALASYLEWDSRQATASPQTGSGGRPRPGRCRAGTGTAGGPPDVAVAGADDGQDSQPAEVPMPGPDEAVSFGAHIRPLFRERDRQSMSFAFDLWSAGDVRAHAAGILERLRNGSMPCDGAWPDGPDRRLRALGRIRPAGLASLARRPRSVGVAGWGRWPGGHREEHSLSSSAALRDRARALTNRRVNPLFVALLTRGLGPPTYAIVETIGRRTGRRRWLRWPTGWTATPSG